MGERELRRMQGEPSGTPPAGRAEAPKPRMLREDSMMLKSEVALHQKAADGLTQAGLGTYSFTIAEQQIVPTTGQALAPDSPFLVITYNGLAENKKLWSLVSDAKVARKDAERAGKPEEAVDQAVQNAIQEGIDRELKSKAHANAMFASLSKKSRP